MMIDYSKFSVERFVMDEGFQAYVKHATPETELIWEEWLKLHPHKAEEVRQARLILLSMEFKKLSDQQIPKEKLLQRIQATIHRERKMEVPVRRISFLQRYQRIAAVFLGLLIATASLYLLTYEPSQRYTTAYGEIKHLTLPDGSKVSLNANSSVQYKKAWREGDAREVVLDGEAFFEVVHTDNHERFVVHTNQIDVEVLGTKFNVQSRREQTRVVLNSGKVKIDAKGPEGQVVYMEPGELAEVDGAEHAVTKTKVDAAAFSAWTKRQLIFQATPVGEIAKILEDTYGWKPVFEDESIKGYRFTGSVSTKSVDEISILLYTISESFDIEVRREGDQLIFRKNK